MNKTKRYNNVIISTKSNFSAGYYQFESIYICFKTDSKCLGNSVVNFKLGLN